MNAYGLGSWGAVVERTFGDVAVAASAEGFRAALRHRSWGSLALSVVDSTPACVEGSTHPARAPQGCFLFLNLLGHTTVSQGGRSALLSPGDLTVVRQAEPYRLVFDETHRMQILTVSELDGRCALDDHMARCHTPQEAALLAAYMARLAAMDEAMPLQDGLRLTQDLLALCWPRVGQAAQESALAAWERPLLALIARELCDPELDARTLGRQLGISARYVQMVLARRGTTLTAYLLEQRLLRAAQRLRDRDTMRIGDIALDAGFSDLSHFCHSFRQRFGCSASDWRRAH
jgi:AraC-like DNA-binding protein